MDVWIDGERTGSGEETNWRQIPKSKTLGSSSPTHQKPEGRVQRIDKGTGGHVQRLKLRDLFHFFRKNLEPHQQLNPMSPLPSQSPAITPQASLTVLLDLKPLGTSSIMFQVLGSHPEEKEQSREEIH